MNLKNAETKSFRLKTYEALNKYEKKGTIGNNLNIFLTILIILNGLAVALETIDALDLKYGSFFNVFEWFSLFVFAIEYLARLWSAPERKIFKVKTAASKRFRYMFSFMGLMDLAPLIPVLIQWFVPVIDLRWMRIIRLLTFLKSSYLSMTLTIFTKMVYEERKKLYLASYLMFISLALSSSAIYFAENKVQPEIFNSIPAAFSWSLLTLTKVGYRHSVPFTFAGKVIGIITAFSGVWTFALFTTILYTGLRTQSERYIKRLNTPQNDLLTITDLNKQEVEILKEIKEHIKLNEDQTMKLAQILTDKNYFPTQRVCNLNCVNL